jgi:hypothetical protein
MQTLLSLTTEDKGKKSLCITEGKQRWNRAKFCCSHGWFNGFRNCANLQSVEASGEVASADTVAAEVS